MDSFLCGLPFVKTLVSIMMNSDNIGTIGYESEQFWIAFTYSDELRQSIYDNIPQSERTWIKSDGRWWITQAAAHGVERFATINGLEVLPEAQSAFTAISLAGIEQVKVETTNQRKIELETNCFVISFPPTPVLVNAIKALAVRTFDWEKKYWSVPIEYADDVRHFANLYNFELSEEVQQLLSEQKSEALPDFNSNLLKGTLFKFQEAGVQVMMKHKRFLLGDEMGTGKTIQTIATAMQANTFPVLIVCPKKLVLNWRNEWRQWTDKRIHVVGENSFGQSLYKSGSTLTMADVYIVNYEGISKVEKAAKHFSFVCFDEAHFLKNPKAKRTLLAKKIASTAEYVIALTGTPVVNDTRELYTLLHILKVDHLFQGYHMKYVDTKKRGKQIYNQHLKELNMLLNRHCYLRREKKDVLPDLPDKIRQKIYVEMDESSKAKYKLAFQDLGAYLSRHKGKSEEQIDKAVKNERLIKINYLKQVAAEGKLAQGVELAESLLDQGEKVVLFAHHLDIIDKLMLHFAPYGAVKIDGRIGSAEIVNNNIHQFQNNSKCRVIVCSLTAAGVGITLTASSRVIFFEMGWTPSVMSQAEDRCHRNGAKDVVYAYYILANDTIDEKIYNIIERKRAVADIVAGATTNIQTEIITDLWQYLKENAG